MNAKPGRFFSIATAFQEAAEKKFETLHPTIQNEFESGEYVEVAKSCPTLFFVGRSLLRAEMMGIVA